MSQLQASVYGVGQQCLWKADGITAQTGSISSYKHQQHHGRYNQLYHSQDVYFPFHADVSLPAILMPTKLGHVYSPRAHCYFHPTGKHKKSLFQYDCTITVHTGTSEPRVTQAPAMFKLPVLKNKDVSSIIMVLKLISLTWVIQKLTTMNLFDINELFCQSADPNWLKTSDQSPAFTPAPPSSALGFNSNNHPNTSPTLARKVKWFTFLFLF